MASTISTTVTSKPIWKASYTVQELRHLHCSNAMSEQLEHLRLGKITIMRLVALVGTKIAAYKLMSSYQSGVGKDIPMGHVLVVRTVCYLLKQALFPTTPRYICRLSGADICGNRSSDKCGTARI